MAALSPPQTFKRRVAFLRLAAQGHKIVKPGFVMQTASAAPDEPLCVGYTATKKLGNAVARNRARRRLKEAARLEFAAQDLRGRELVLICRQETAGLAFSALRGHLASALSELRRRDPASS